MFAELIRLLIAAACALFVLSLPLSKTETGATLRRWAAVAFTLALLPSLIIGLFYARPTPDTTSSAAQTSGTGPQSLLADLGCVALIVIIALVAYMTLKLRSRFVSKKPKTRDPWEAFFNRGGGKRPFTMHTSARPSPRPSPFTYDDEDESA